MTCSTFLKPESKLTGDAVIEPEEFVSYFKRRGKAATTVFPEKIIICYQKHLLQHVVAKYESKERLSVIEPLYLINHEGCSVGVIGDFGIGAPAAAMMLELLIANGAGHIISVGSAGALQKELAPGDLVICNRAIRDEGTSGHYFAKGKYADASFAMTGHLQAVAKKCTQKLKTRTSWTTDALFRETPAEIAAYQKEGVATVEMEAAALFSVARYRDIELGCLLVISDSLADLEWRAGFHLKPVFNGLKLAFDIALEALVSFAPEK
jgi:purine-nucleoside phosphorylase